MIGILSSGPAEIGPNTAALLAGLADQGWRLGRDFTLERRIAVDGYAAMPLLAAELVRLSPDVIFGPGSAEAQILHGLTRSIPIVTAAATDPIGTGLVASYSRPGGNVTGVVWDMAPAVTGKYVEFLKELVPRLKMLGCLIDPTIPGIQTYRDALESACARLGVVTVHVAGRKVEDLAPAIGSLADQGARALFCYGSPLTVLQPARIVALAAAHHLPDAYIFREAANAGGLMSFGPNYAAMYRLAARFVDRILKGANPAELPMEQPTVYELLVNRKTANRLGLKIPPSLLARADEVIE